MKLWGLQIAGGPKRVNHSAIATGNKIFSFGGYDEEDDAKDYSNRLLDVHVFLTSCNKWVNLGVPNYFDPQFKDVPFQRYGHTVVCHEKIAYLWGGRNNETADSVIHLFDTEKLLWTKPTVLGDLPSPRDGHSACVIGHFMYIFGGFLANAEVFTQDLYEFNLHALEWCHIYSKGHVPSHRDFHTACDIDGKMFVFGGRGDVHILHHTGKEVYDDSVYCFDPVSKHWTCLETTGDKPTGRRSHSVFVYKKKMYIFGGFNGLLRRHFNDLYEFDPSTNHWTLIHCLGKYPCPRRRHCFCIIGSRAYAFGGTNPRNDDVKFPDCLLEHNVDVHESLKGLNDLHILDFDPTLQTFSLLAVIENGFNPEELPVCLRSEVGTLATERCIKRKERSA